MLGALTNVVAAATDIHVSLKPETVLQVGNVSISNAMVYGILTAIFTGWLLIWANKKITVKSGKGFAVIIELLVEFMINTLEGAFSSRKKAIKYTPIFAAFFIFIFFSNLLELLPLVGPGLTAGGSPLFRPFTADYNGTVALAVIAILTVQVLSIRAQGVKGHLEHYFTNKPLNPLNMFIGLLEVFGELTRVLSLSLRLFLNMAVGEILITVFTSLVISDGRTPLAAIPIFVFETLVAGIQAYVFTVLSATYLSLAIMHAHDEDGHDPVALKVEGANA